MSRYADMIYEAVQCSNYKNGISIQRVNLASPHNIIKRFPHISRSWFHHFTIFINSAVHLPKIQADLFHVVDGSHAYVAFFLNPRKTIATAHDIIPFLQLYGHFGKNSTQFPSRWLVQKSVCALRKIRLILSVSDNTVRDLVKYADIEKNRTKTVFHPVPDSLLNYSLSNRAPDWSERRHSREPYILHVGNNAFYKNRTGLLRIFSIVRTSYDINLKLVGPQPNRNEKMLIDELRHCQIFEIHQ